jgi:hypothetical protein
MFERPVKPNHPEHSGLLSYRPRFGF